MYKMEQKIIKPSKANIPIINLEVEKW